MSTSHSMKCTQFLANGEMKNFTQVILSIKGQYVLKLSREKLLSCAGRNYSITFDRLFGKHNIWTGRVDSEVLRPLPVWGYSKSVRKLCIYDNWLKNGKYCLHIVWTSPWWHIFKICFLCFFFRPVLKSVPVKVTRSTFIYSVLTGHWCLSRRF